RALVVFTYGGEKATIGDVIAAVKTNQELKNLSLKDPSTFKTIADKIGTSLVVEFHARTMENTFPDFAQTMKEYEDGILLFKAEQENVWNKVVPTDSALHAYYSANHTKYTWPDRVNFQEIFVASDSMAGVIKKALTGYTIDSLVVKKTKKRTKKPLYDTVKIAVAPISFDSAAVLYNKRGSTIHNRGIWGLQPIGSELTKRAWDETSNDTTNYFPNDGGFSFIKVIQKDPAREKTFEEAQSELSGAFQESETKRIESAWYDSLKKKYPVVLNKEALAQTFSSSQPAPAKQ
ncbi:MAG: peptidyl-prolyl cis-trans isomerase, partial [Bacteroidota bacterium]